MPHFIFIQQISVLNILNMLCNLHFFSLQKCRLFHNATLFGFCITHILNTGCDKIWKKKSVAKRLIMNSWATTQPRKFCSSKTLVSKLIKLWPTFTLWQLTSCSGVLQGKPIFVHLVNDSPPPWFQTSAIVQIRSQLVWDFTQRRVVLYC